MSKIGQNSMKKWPFFAIILPWMASYGSEISFLLVFSAREDLVKVSWKSDARKCQNQVTPFYFDYLSESSMPLWKKKTILCLSVPKEIRRWECRNLNCHTAWPFASPAMVCRLEIENWRSQAWISIFHSDDNSSLCRFRIHQVQLLEFHI